MKRTTFFNLLILGLVLAVSTTACKKKPYTTTIPGRNIGSIPNPRPTGDTSGTFGNNASSGAPTFSTDGTGIPMADNPGDWQSRAQDREKFAADIVYFSLDSATIKDSEKAKIEAVAAGFKAESAGDLLIEGHCDERGTEGYNLALGDKRANSLREYLVNLGVSADKIHTVSFGEAKPAVDGHDESAWSKNRRGEFVFIQP